MQARLGSFALDRQIGQGGMGAVWLAEHVTQRVPIAIKVDLHPPDDAYSAAFLHEVEAVAALDHKNIVLVLEHGMVDRAAQDATGGDLRAGSRWLAMELAPGGSVADRPPRNWTEVLHVARGTLDALAHSHARRVIHRDIKPANLLLAGSDEGVSTVPEGLLDARIVLSDFGISERHDVATTHTEDSVGTPHYMAPEQIEAQWRVQGPWTDLYAVGVLLWRLTTGSYPFEGRNAFQIYRQHLLQQPPAFKPQMGVPEGLEEILRTCLAKAPQDRFAFAASMRRALDSLGSAHGDGAVEPLEDEATLRAPSTHGATAGATRRRNRTSPTKERPRNFQLQGAGLSLFGIRTPPLVGREELCDSLWGRLIEVRSAGQARVVVLRGTSGTGKSRLARWLCERAHELGVVDSLRAEFEPDLPPGEPLLRMFRHHLRLDDLDAEALDARLEQLFPDAPFDRTSLGALLFPHLSTRGLLTRRQARVLLLAALTQLATQQALILHLDDAHLDLEALELVDHLLALQGMRPCPILVVLTVIEDALVERPAAQELLAEITDDPAVANIEIGPLSSEAQAKLVRTLVGLDGAIAKRLEERTAGNPMFAVQLIGAWIDQGVLVPGPDGFRVRPGAETLPLDLTSVWDARVDDLLEGRTADDATALECAAAMGLQVEHQAWLETFELLEIEPSSDLFEELRRRHLVRTTDSTGHTWRFAHGLLRECVEQRARHEDRWYDVNLAAAIQIRQSGVRAPLRLARHLLAAEVWDQAAEPLEQALVDEWDRNDLRDDTLLRQLIDVLERLELPASDPWWGRLKLIQAGRARSRGELEDAERIVEDLLVDLEQVDWPEIRGKALREASRILFTRGDRERAQGLAERAVAAFEAIGDTMRATDAGFTVGLILSGQGRYDEARARYLNCVEVFEANGWEAFLRGPLESLIILEQRAGNLDEALKWLARTRDYATRMGMQSLLANCANVEGEIARKGGDLEHAAACYRESTERYEALEDPAFAFPALNLAILDVGASRFAAASARMRLLLLFLERAPRPMLHMYAHLVLMAAEAGLGDVESAAVSLGHVVAYLDNASMVDGDIAQMADLAARGFRRQGAADEERQAVTLAIAQYRGLGDEAAAVRLERRL